MNSALIATLLFATSSVTARKTVSILGPASANFWRILIASFALTIIAQFRGQHLGGVAFGWFLFSGLVGYGIGDFGIFRALPLLGSRLSSLLTQCLAAPFAALVEWAWLGTRLTLDQIAAGILILGGVAIAIAPERGEPGTTPVTRPWLGVFFGVVAAIGQAGGAVLSRHGMLLEKAAGQSVDGLTVAFRRILPGLAFAAIWWIWSWRGNPSPIPVRTYLSASGKGILPWVVVNGLLGPCIGVAYYQAALQQQPTGVVLPIVALTPLVVIPLAMWLEKERPRLRSILAGCIAVCGAVWLAGGSTWVRKFF